MDNLQVPALDHLELTVVVDNETDFLSSVDDDVDQLPELAALLGRIPPTRHHDGNAAIPVFDHICVACHGLSVLVTGRHQDQTRSALFDVGPDGDLWLENSERLAIDLRSIDVMFLSHWHADHSGGFPAVTAAVAAARSDAGLAPPIVDLHPDRPDQRGVQLPDLFLGSGLIARVTAYETGLFGHHTFHGDECEPDPLILDERFLAAHVRGRGVSVLSACSHAGIVNACLGAQALIPDIPIDVVLGGYHLAGAAMEKRIPETVRDLAELIDPRIVAPGHCTGWRAKAALAYAFAPGRYGPSVVGSRYRLAAPS